MNKIKQKTYLNIFIFSFAIVAIFYVGNSYLIKTVKNLSGEIIDKKQQIEKLNKQSAQIDDVRIGYNYIQKETDEVSNLIINYQEIINFIIEIENIAQESEVNIEINVSKKEREYLNDTLSFVNYNLKATGDFDNLMRFLVYLENLKYLSEIENIRMSYNDKDKSSFVDSEEIDLGKIVLNTNLKVYLKN